LRFRGVSIDQDKTSSILSRRKLVRPLFPFAARSLKAHLAAIMFLSTCALAAEPADTLYLIGGNVKAGIITSASAGSVTLTVGREQMVFKNSVVNRYVFSSADKLALTGGDTLLCKVLRKQGENLTVITSGGPRILNKNEFAGVDYNSGGKLVVTEFPETDQTFHPLQFRGEPGKGTELYLRAGYGYHSGTLDQWQQAWTNHQAPTSGPVIPLEVGVALGPHWMLGAGYEHFKTKTVAGSDAYRTFTGDLAYDFIYVGLRWQSSPLGNSLLRIYGSGIFGSIKVTENINRTGGLNTITPADPTSATIGVRANVGVSADICPWARIFLEGRFLFARADPVPSTYTELDIGGLGVLAGVEFHFVL
jgi:hypothetical protein